MDLLPAVLLLLALRAGAPNVEAPGASTCRLQPSNWSRMAAAPATSESRPVNVLVVQSDGHLRWNGSSVTEAQAREYLGLLPQMVANWLMVLTLDRGADCNTVSRTRKMMDSVLSCNQSNCAEVSAIDH